MATSLSSDLVEPVFVSALETVKSLRKRCAKIGITANFNLLDDEMSKSKKAKTKPIGGYEVERILDYDTTNFLYLVKWKGWDIQYNTWEPIDHLRSCQHLVDDFRLMLRSLSHSNKIAFKKLIFLHCVIEMLTSPGYEDPILLLKLNEKSPSNYQLEDLVPLKKELKRKCTLLHQCLKENEMKLSRNYDRLLEKVLKDLQINETFESFEKFEEFLAKRKNIFKKLKTLEVNINRILSLEEGFAPIVVENNIDLEVPKDFNYITKCQPGVNVNIDDEPLRYCECEICPSNRKSCCSCIQHSNIYDENGRLKKYGGITIYECNSKCKCLSTCKNRVIQKGRKFKLAIFKTDNGRGWGVKTLDKILKGHFVVEYVGEIITMGEAERRFELGENPFHETYLFDLNYSDGADGTECEYVVNGAQFSNVSRFINHSCSPNLEVKLFWIDNANEKMPRIAFFSQKTIKKGEELTLDYQMNAPRMIDTNGAVKFVKVPCKCMSSKCRKFLF